MSIELTKGAVLIDEVGGEYLVRFKKDQFLKMKRFFKSKQTVDFDAPQDISFEFTPPLDPKEILQHFNKI